MKFFGRNKKNNDNKASDNSVIAPQEPLAQTTQQVTAAQGSQTNDFTSQIGSNTPPPSPIMTPDDKQTNFNQPKTTPYSPQIPTVAPASPVTSSDGRSEPVDTNPNSAFQSGFTTPDSDVLPVTNDSGATSFDHPISSAPSPMLDPVAPKPITVTSQVTSLDEPNITSYNSTPDATASPVSSFNSQSTPATTSTPINVTVPEATTIPPANYNGPNPPPTTNSYNPPASADTVASVQSSEVAK